MTVNFLSSKAGFWFCLEPVNPQLSFPTPLLTPVRFKVSACLPSTPTQGPETNSFPFSWQDIHHQHLDLWLGDSWVEGDQGRVTTTQGNWTMNYVSSSSWNDCLVHVNWLLDLGTHSKYYTSSGGESKILSLFYVISQNLVCCLFPISDELISSLCQGL